MFLNSSLKMANIKAVSKKGTKSHKENYRPISILHLVSRIFKRIICKQLTTFFDNILSKRQCGFRKSHGTQYCLLLMLEKWKKALDNKEVFGALLTDLSKVLIASMIVKLHAHSLSLSSLKLIHDYLLDRKQRTEVNSKYSS